MKKEYINGAILILFLSFTGSLAIHYFGLVFFTLTMEKLLTLSIFILVLGIVGFFFFLAWTSKKNDSHALGLPQGSVRAILAFILLLSFILISALFYLEATGTFKQDLAERILTVLATLVIAVSGFYFGVKATEQGGRIVKEAFRDVKAVVEGNPQKPYEPDFSLFNGLSLKERETILLELVDKFDEEWFDQYPNLTGIEIGYKEEGNSESEILCVKFQVDNKTNSIAPSQKLPKYLQFKGYDIQTDVIQCDMSIAMVRASDKIERGSGKGTLGFIAKNSNGTEFLVSNYHVIFDQELRADKFSVEVTSTVANRDVLDIGGNTIATAKRGVLNKFKDVAIAEIKTSPANTSIPSIGSPSGSFTPSSDNINDLVKMNGAASPNKNGKLKSVSSTQTIGYVSNTRRVKIKGLLKIDIVSKPGDSGSAVLNDRHQVIGILVGGDNKSSYLVPIDRCLKPYNLKI